MAVVRGFFGVAIVMSVAYLLLSLRWT